MKTWKIYAIFLSGIVFHSAFRQLIEVVNADTRGEFRQYNATIVITDSLSSFLVGGVLLGIFLLLMHFFTSKGEAMKKIRNNTLTIIVYIVVIIIALMILRSMFSGQSGPSASNGWNYGQLDIIKPITTNSKSLPV